MLYTRPGLEGVCEREVRVQVRLSAARALTLTGVVEVDLSPSCPDSLYPRHSQETWSYVLSLVL